MELILGCSQINYKQTAPTKLELASNACRVLHQCNDARMEANKNWSHAQRKVFLLRLKKVSLLLAAMIGKQSARIGIDFLS
jgi:hypothetical protein